jgi:hypothetical protein
LGEWEGMQVGGETLAPGPKRFGLRGGEEKDRDEINFSGALSIEPYYI